MDSRAIVNVIDNLESTSATDALSANQGRVLKGLIDDNSIVCQNINEADLNTKIGEVIIAYGNSCTNKPSGAGNGYFINIPHSASANKDIYNKQFWIERILNKVWIRTQENNVFGDWQCISHTIIKTSEILPTNMYIGSKQVYVKRINFGSLPNSSSKEVASGLTLSDITVVDIKGIATGGTDTQAAYLTIPNSHPTSSNNISVYISSDSKVVINTGVDRSSFTAVVDIYFTYNS